MKTAAPTRRPPGRHRDDTLDPVILSVVARQLSELGYDALSVEAVARDAGIARTTIYRRWPTKAELVVAAIRWRHEVHVVAHPDDTGSLRGDLLAEVDRLATEMRQETIAQMAGVFLAMRREPELATAFRTQVIDPNRATATAILGRAVDRGEIPAAALKSDIFDQVIPSMLLGRRFGLDLAVDLRFALDLVDTLLIPALQASGTIPVQHTPTNRSEEKS